MSFRGGGGGTAPAARASLASRAAPLPQKTFATFSITLPRFTPAAVMCRSRFSCVAARSSRGSFTFERSPRPLIHREISTLAVSIAASHEIMDQRPTRPAPALSAVQDVPSARYTHLSHFFSPSQPVVTSLTARSTRHQLRDTRPPSPLNSNAAAAPSIHWSRVVRRRGAVQYGSQRKRFSAARLHLGSARLGSA